MADNTSAGKFHVKVDGISWAWFDVAQRKTILDHLRGVSLFTGNTNSKMWTCIQAESKSFKISRISPEGECTDHTWWELLTEFPDCDVDYLRILARGKGYRTNFKQLVELEEECSVDYLMILQELHLDVKDIVRDNNYIAPGVYKEVIKYFQDRRYLLRVSDRGFQMSLVHYLWEESQVEEFVAASRGKHINDELSVNYKLINLTWRSKVDFDTKGRMMINGVILSDEMCQKIRNEENGLRIPRIYFIPKTHKPGLKKGRPIVSLLGCKQHQCIYQISRCLHNWVSRRSPKGTAFYNNSEKPLGFDVIRVEDGVERMTDHTGQYSLVIGDIKNMFTSIPHFMIQEFLDSSDFLEYGMRYKKLSIRWEKVFGFSMTTDCLKQAILNIVGELEFQYNGKVFRMEDGLPMGHIISPCLSRAVITHRESRILRQFNEDGLKYSRYVDDVGLRIPIELEEDVYKKIYEECVSPMKMEWETRQRYLDASFTLGNREFVPKNPLNVISNELPVDCRNACHKSYARRVMQRTQVPPPIVYDVYPNYKIGRSIEYEVLDNGKSNMRYTMTEKEEQDMKGHLIEQLLHGLSQVSESGEGLPSPALVLGEEGEDSPTYACCCDIGNHTCSAALKVVELISNYADAQNTLQQSTPALIEDAKTAGCREKRREKTLHILWSSGLDGKYAYILSYAKNCYPDYRIVYDHSSQRVVFRICAKSAHLYKVQNYAEDVP